MNKFAGKSSEAVKNATGKEWSEWFEILDRFHAEKLPHKEIVLMLHDKNLVKSNWWAQSIVVGYEDKIGRRIYGAKTLGNYSVSVGKTLNGSPDDALKIWQKLVKGKKALNDVKVAGKFRVSSTNDWRYWKVDLEDGSKISVNIGRKTDKRSSLTVTMDKLKGEKEVESWRKYWIKFMNKI